MGDWLIDNWFQLLSGLVLVLTFVTHLWFHSRKDRRERAASKRQEEIHVITIGKMTDVELRHDVHDKYSDQRREDIHDETMRELKHDVDEDK